MAEPEAELLFTPLQIQYPVMLFICLLTTVKGRVITLVLFNVSVVFNTGFASDIFADNLVEMNDTRDLQ